MNSGKWHQHVRWGPGFPWLRLELLSRWKLDVVAIAVLRYPRPEILNSFARNNNYLSKILRSSSLGPCSQALSFEKRNVNSKRGTSKTIENLPKFSCHGEFQRMLQKRECPKSYTYDINVCPGVAFKVADKIKRVPIFYWKLGFIRQVTH